MNICDGLFLNGNPCTYRTKQGSTRCGKHQGIFFCGTDLPDGRRCGARVIEGQTCPKHKFGAVPPQNSQSNDRLTRANSKLKAENARLKQQLDATRSSLHLAEIQIRTSAVLFGYTQEGLLQINRAIRANQETPDRAPVRFRFGDDMLYLNVCSNPGKYKDQTGFGFFRRIPAPEPDASTIVCLLCSESAPRTHLLPCYDDHFSGDDGICHECIAQVCTNQAKPVCPMCRTDIPLDFPRTA